MSQAIDKQFSPYYTLELSLVCKNCGTAKGRWQAASDSATSFNFIMTTCEYCGVFRFEAVLYARFFDNRDGKNMEKAKSKFDKEIQSDARTQRLLNPPGMTKKVVGERIVDKMSSLKDSNWRKGIDE